MPASGWLAIGSVVAALIAADVGALLVAAVAGSLAAAGWGLPGRVAGRAVLGLAVGAGVLAVRLVVAPAPPPAVAQPPDGSGPWVARVESVSAPRDGSQVATLRLESHPAVAVAATLPRFPAIEPGRGFASTARSDRPRRAATATTSVGRASPERSGRDCSSACRVDPVATTRWSSFAGMRPQPWLPRSRSRKPASRRGS